MSIQRINVVGVPVDVCLPEDIEGGVLELLAKPGTKQIVFLSIWDLLKARRKNDYGECVRNADLILPISKSIIKGAKFLKKSIPVRYNRFSAVIEMLSVLERHYKSIYLLGAHNLTLQKAESNVRDTFPDLQIVGRCTGYYSRASEDAVVAAIYKAMPSLVLVSEGIKEKDVWAYNRRNCFASSIFVYYRDAFAIFADRKKRMADKIFNSRLEIVVEILHNPFKIFLIFPYLWYTLLLIWHRLFNNT
ncbi:MAG: WecB/TagA/CpsF family glycosyltransferase [Treponema sp.]|nr:WecB/TagA/CpsF family glycosyltransferase [Treponema sp.]